MAHDEPITYDEMIAWMKADPEKVQRIMKAERVVGPYGEILITYHDGKLRRITATSNRRV